MLCPSILCSSCLLFCLQFLFDWGLPLRDSWKKQSIVQNHASIQKFGTHLFFHICSRPPMVMVGHLPLFGGTCIQAMEPSISHLLVAVPKKHPESNKCEITTKQGSILKWSFYVLPYLCKYNIHLQSLNKPCPVKPSQGGSIFDHLLLRGWSCMFHCFPSFLPSSFTWRNSTTILQSKRAKRLEPLWPQVIRCYKSYDRIAHSSLESPDIRHTLVHNWGAHAWSLVCRRQVAVKGVYVGTEASVGIA